jgi:hypothetical protein
MDTQLASTATDHVQSRAAVIASEPEPPFAVNADGAVLAVTWHLSAVGALTDVCVELQADAQAAASTQIEASARIRQRMRRLSRAERSQAAGQRQSLKR